jgi:hypothetical protein
MPHYDVMQVCVKGHQITAHYNSSPERRQDFCKECGFPTIFACPRCKEAIRGEYNVSGVVAIGFEVPVPEFCHKCGEPYPWTKENHQKKSIDDKMKDDYWEEIEFVCSRFHTVAKQIQKRHDNRPTLEIKDEYDVQDLLHAILRMFFDDIRPEEHTPSYAGGSARMDFLLKSHGTVIEVKKTRKGLRDKEIGNQLVEDIARYRKHKDCRILVCFIYDPEGIITNPKGLIKDLSEESDEFSVRVLIQP